MMTWDVPRGKRDSPSNPVKLRESPMIGQVLVMAWIASAPQPYGATCGGPARVKFFVTLERTVRRNSLPRSGRPRRSREVRVRDC
jgi:hypothetical protein